MQDPDPKCRHFGISWHFMAFWHFCQKVGQEIRSDFSDFQTFPDFPIPQLYATPISDGIFLLSKQSNLSTFFSLSIGKMQKLEEMQICQRLLQSELVQKRNKLNYMPSLFDRNIIERSASQHFQNPPIFERSKKKGRKQREIRKSRKYTENLRQLQIVASAKREEGKR